MWPLTRRQQSTTMFEDKSVDVIVHFPSMSFAKTGLAPMLFGGQLQRTEGPKWWFRLDSRKPFEAAEGEMAHLAARIENAYQVYLRNPNGSLLQSDPAVFFEGIRVVMSRQIGEQCVILLPTDHDKEKTEAE